MGEIEYHGLLNMANIGWPNPALKTRKAIDRLAAGEVLKVVSTDLVSMSDIPAFVERVGYELLSVNENNHVYTFYIRKKVRRSDMYEALFSSYEIGGLKLKNRITAAPLYVGLGRDGEVTEAAIAHYAKLAASEVALVVVEATSVSSSDNGSLARGLLINHDRFISGLRKLSDAIKKNGAVSAIQVLHAGRLTRVQTPLAPSAIPFSPMPNVTVTPREMDGNDIKNTIDDYAQAARRAREAGFDMVEIHGSTGYLITQFLSPLTNIRTDNYGGDALKRMNFPLEVFQAMKDAAGRDYPIGIRFIADDFMPNGYNINDSKIFAGRLEGAGAAYLSVTGGVYESWAIPEVAARLKEKGSLAVYSKELKATIKTPIFAGNRISSPDIANEIIANGEADCIALGRPLLRDPEFALKAKDGKADKISECISCRGCAGLVVKGESVHCVQVKK